MGSIAVARLLAATGRLERGGLLSVRLGAAIRGKQTVLFGRIRVVAE